MKCPICHKLIESDNLMWSHLEFHKSQSNLSEQNKITNLVLDKKFKRINTHKIFGQERFEKLILKKTQHIIDTEELVYQRNFIEQIKIIVPRHPFLFVTYFIDDLFEGMSSTDLCKKYSISTQLDLQSIVQKILKFKGYRYRKSQYDDAYQMNLKISTWNDKYHIFKNNCNYFQDELLQLFFYNIVSSYVVIIMMDHTKDGLTRENIINSSKDLENNLMLFQIIDLPLKKKLEQYFTKGFENIVNEVITELVEEKILHKKSGNPTMLISTFSIDKIKEEIISELHYNPDIRNNGQIRWNITMKYQSMRMLPGINIWNTAINELESEKIIRLEYDLSSKKLPLIFLEDNYQYVQNKLEKLDPTQIQFHGRSISPEKFIEELSYLEIGDFDDEDDQITRIAGLVLAESVKLQSPHEEIDEFDFSMNISNYNFSPDQINAIKTLNFVITSNIFHCRVMLGNTLTLIRYQKIKDSLPSGHQGIVITFNKIPFEVQQILQNDKSIQVINKDGLKTWASITPIIPSRKNAVVKINFDPISNIENRLAKVNLINYESGLASVLILPDMTETTVLVRSLEEITLYEEHPNDFEPFTFRYLEFLDILAKLSTTTNLNDAFFKTEIINLSSKNSKSSITADFEHNKSSLNFNQHDAYDIFNCECMGWAENKLNLCPHLIHLLDSTVRKFSSSFLDFTWDENSNILKQALTDLIKNNISIILDKLEIETDNDKTESYQKMQDFILAISKIREK